MVVYILNNRHPWDHEFVSVHASKEGAIEAAKRQAGGFEVQVHYDCDSFTVLTADGSRMRWEIKPEEVKP